MSSEGPTIGVSNSAMFNVGDKVSVELDKWSKYVPRWRWLRYGRGYKLAKWLRLVRTARQNFDITVVL